eukprot:4003555-Amphidinium_carterae.1
MGCSGVLEPCGRSWGSCVCVCSSAATHEPTDAHSSAWGPVVHLVGSRHVSEGACASGLD